MKFIHTQILGGAQLKIHYEIFHFRSRTHLSHIEHMPLVLAYIKRKEIDDNTLNI